MITRMPPRRAAKLLAGAIILAAVGGGLSACSTTSSQGPHKLKVVTSTAVWGSIVQAIAGDKVEVKSIVNNPNQDPHSFEASVRDQAAVNGADLVFLTGNGYDSFIDQLISASKQPKQHIIKLAPNDTLVEPAYSDKVIDPHVWYDFAIVERIANTITENLTSNDRADADIFKAGNEAFKKQLDALASRLDTAAHSRVCHTAQRATDKPCKVLAYTSILQPESVGLRLISKFAVDITPATVRQAVMNDSDISVADMALMKTYFFGSIEHDGLHFAANTPVNWLVLNAQQTNSQTKLLQSWAKKTATPILSYSENLPVGDSYISWMSHNVAQIENVIR